MSSQCPRARLEPLGSFNGKNGAVQHNGVLFLLFSLKKREARVHPGEMASGRSPRSHRISFAPPKQDRDNPGRSRTQQDRAGADGPGHNNTRRSRTQKDQTVPDTTGSDGPRQPLARRPRTQQDSSGTQQGPKGPGHNRTRKPRTQTGPEQGDALGHLLAAAKQMLLRGLSTRAVSRAPTKAVLRPPGLRPKGRFPGPTSATLRFGPFRPLPTSSLRERRIQPKP